MIRAPGYVLSKNHELRFLSWNRTRAGTLPLRPPRFGRGTPAACRDGMAEPRRGSLRCPPSSVRHWETAMYDLVIRGATIVDGLGHDPLRADIAVHGGR